MFLNLPLNWKQTLPALPRFWGHIFASLEHALHSKKIRHYQFADVFTWPDKFQFEDITTWFKKKSSQVRWKSISQWPNPSWSPDEHHLTLLASECPSQWEAQTREPRDAGFKSWLLPCCVSLGNTLFLNCTIPQSWWLLYGGSVNTGFWIIAGTQKALFPLCLCNIYGLDTVWHVHVSELTVHLR